VDPRSSSATDEKRHTGGGPGGVGVSRCDSDLSMCPGYVPADRRAHDALRQHSEVNPGNALATGLAAA
jgi:hypothetical protein